VFAPGAGRPLGVAAGLLLLGVVLVLARELPASPALVGLLLLGGAFWLFFAVFFRDPERVTGEGVVSAADGVVRAVTEEGDRTRVSVFMNVTDVHVNRLPTDATVRRVGDGGSGYRPAYRSDADRNVARTYDLDTAYGPVQVVQITGVVARRLVSFVRAGQSGHRGDRFGMIVLGSRVDVLFPSGRLVPTVRPGERVWAGRSTIARERS
jgi:phosphatidylserine decarboxylase